MRFFQEGKCFIQMPLSTQDNLFFTVQHRRMMPVPWYRYLMFSISLLPHGCGESDMNPDKHVFSRFL